MPYQQLNQGNWGVCGFVAALQAARANGQLAASPHLLAALDAVQLADAARNYAVMQELFGRLFPGNDTALLHGQEQELLDFSEQIGYGAYRKEERRAVAARVQGGQVPDSMRAYRPQNPYHYPTIRRVLELMMANRAMDETVGLALTSKALLTVCKALGFKNANFIGETSPRDITDGFPYLNCIYGLRTADTAPLSFRFGLEHWVYVGTAGNNPAARIAEPMTWGRQGADATAALQMNGLRYISSRINLGV